jgi:bacillithiol system protein YtxJ
MGWFDHWRKKPVPVQKEEEAAAAPGAPPHLDLQRLAAQERVVVFKHSRSCPVSWRADRQVQEFSQRHPEIPVFKLVVQNDRELSRRIAEWTGIEHASPQVIVLRHGVVASAESHEGVTAENLHAAITAA